jgi:hypothetical protein
MDPNGKRMLVVGGGSATRPYGTVTLGAPLSMHVSNAERSTCGM